MFYTFYRGRKWGSFNLGGGGQIVLVVSNYV